jgi:peptide/nickel transport system substrate-binding protein
MDDGSIVPGIARSWEPAEDGLSFEFRLRSDAVFSDGTPIDADIITENFNRWFDPEHPLHGPDNDVYEAWLEYFKGFRNEVDANDKPLSLFDGIEKVDNLTVLIHIYKPMPDFLEIISLPYFSILNPETLEAEGENYGTSADSVVGSGPYVIEDWSGEALTLNPSESYWGPQPQDDIVFTLE